MFKKDKNNETHEVTGRPKEVVVSNSIHPSMKMNMVSLQADDGSKDYGIYNNNDDPQSSMLEARITQSQNIETIYADYGYENINPNTMYSLETQNQLLVISHIVEQELLNIQLNIGAEMNDLLRRVADTYKLNTLPTIGFDYISENTLTFIGNVVREIDVAIHKKMTFEEMHRMFTELSLMNYVSSVYNDMLSHIQLWIYITYNGSKYDPLAIYDSIGMQLSWIYGTFHKLCTVVFCTIPYRITETNINIEQLKPANDNNEKVVKITEGADIPLKQIADAAFGPDNYKYVEF